MTTRALILGDIEGITGVDDWRQIFDGHDGYDAACRDYEADVNAAAAGLRAGGADEVLVVDTHGAGRNVRAEALRDCRLIDGPNMMGRIDEAYAAGIDALALVGYHAAAGTPDGFVPHSFAVQTRSWVDGRLAGEPAFYALMAAARGVPTIAVTGDAQTVRQLRDFGPAARAVETKRSSSPWLAESHDRVRTRATIAETLAAAFRERAELPAAATGARMTLAVETQTEVAARLVATIPGMEPGGGRVATFGGDWASLWRAFVTANSLAALAAAAGGSWYFGALPESLDGRFAAALGDGAAREVGAFYAAQFSPPWGPTCPPELIPWAS